MSYLFDIASKSHSGHPGTKPLTYYKKYDDFLNHHNISPKSIVEIGTFEGESTKIISKSFPDSKILTLDILNRPIDFSDYPNVIYKQVDQTNRDELIQIINNYHPEGVDLVIDDASHIGFFSKLTFEIVFPLVKPHGCYFIEDWGTGYWDSWPDGSRFDGFPIAPHTNNLPKRITLHDAGVVGFVKSLIARHTKILPKRITSHDAGMVGFVKSLVDYTHESAIKNNQNDESKYSSRIEVLEFGEGVCMAIKSK